MKARTESRSIGWLEQCWRAGVSTSRAEARGLVRRYVEKMTGLSRAQVTRLIAPLTAAARDPARRLPSPSFPQRYTGADIELLATVERRTKP